MKMIKQINQDINILCLKKLYKATTLSIIVIIAVQIVMSGCVGVFVPVETYLSPYTMLMEIWISIPK